MSNNLFTRQYSKAIGEEIKKLGLIAEGLEDCDMCANCKYYIAISDDYSCTNISSISYRKHMNIFALCDKFSRKA